jgi:cytochrome c biogenesis protein ResB
MTNMTDPYWYWERLWWLLVVFATLCMLAKVASNRRARRRALRAANENLRREAEAPVEGDPRSRWGKPL